MIQLGEYNTLQAKREMPQGMYLMSLDDDEEVLLPSRFVKEHNIQLDQEVRVFVYTDSEDRLVATTQTPYVTLHKFAYLEVVDTNPFGAFLDWGLDKQLFVPYRNQKLKMEVGRSYLIYLYEDEESDRLVGTAKYSKLLSKVVFGISVGDEVEIIVDHKTDLGMNVVVNNQYSGLIYENELFKKIQQGNKLSGFVKKIREDGKLDISLEPLGYKSIEPNAAFLLDYLKLNKGVVYLSDKSSPELIKDTLEMSKKNFKKAIGGLYKQRLIVIHEDRVELV